LQNYVGILQACTRRIDRLSRTRRLERIGQLYGIEQEIQGRSPGERKEVRQARSRPLLGVTQAWLKATLGKLSRKSEVAVAIRDVLQRWSALLRYCEDGRVEMDNNAAERVLRVLAAPPARSVTAPP
jgi:hypothetical protein